MFSFVTNNTLADEVIAAATQSKNCTLALVVNHQIIHKGNFRILKHSWSKTLTQVYTQAEGWLNYCCRLPGNNSASKEKVIESNNSVPFLRQVVFMLTLFWNYCRQRIQLVFTKEVWNVGIIAKPINESLQPGFNKDIFWLPHPAHGIFADPFGYETESSVKIIFENLDFKSNHGKLSLLEFDKQSTFTNGKTFINKKEHLSYPYLFEENDTLYMLPECCELNKLCLYELNKKTLTVEKDFVLIENIKAVDPSVIFYNNKWWLFCTLKNDKPDLKLHLYFSDTLTGNWQPHKLNPVKIDISSSRPGGTMFIDCGKLYRPSQDSSYSYGDRIVLNEVTELSESSFSEKEVAVVSPHILKNYKKGLHTHQQMKKWK